MGSARAPMGTGCSLALGAGNWAPPRPHTCTAAEAQPNTIPETCAKKRKPLRWRQAHPLPQLGTRENMPRAREKEDEDGPPAKDGTNTMHGHLPMLGKPQARAPAVGRTARLGTHPVGGERAAKGHQLLIWAKAVVTMTARVRLPSMKKQRKDTRHADGCDITKHERAPGGTLSVPPGTCCNN